MMFSIQVSKMGFHNHSGLLETVFADVTDRSAQELVSVEGCKRRLDFIEKFKKYYDAISTNSSFS